MTKHPTKTSYGIDTTLGFQWMKQLLLSRFGLYAHNKLKDIDPEYHRALYLELIEADSWEFSNDDFDFQL